MPTYSSNITQKIDAEISSTVSAVNNTPISLYTAAAGRRAKVRVAVDLPSLSNTFAYNLNVGSQKVARATFTTGTVPGDTMHNSAKGTGETKVASGDVISLHEGYLEIGPGQTLSFTSNGTNATVYITGVEFANTP